MQKLNIVVLGGFPYPRGMAGTKRIQHAIDGMKEAPDVSICVLVLRQSSSRNTLAGMHAGIPYETVMGDLARVRLTLLFPVLTVKAMRALKRSWRPDCRNIIYLYGPPSLDNIVPILYCRHLGYKIVFDIVEDYDLAWSLSRSFYHRLKMAGRTRLTRCVKSLASGIVVISSHLIEKYRGLTQGQVPMHHRPISVDLDCFPAKSRRFGDTVKLFYSGSFGKKDGVPVLLEAFDRLAAKFDTVRLVLTGKGSDEAMRPILSRIESSPFRDRIDYKGYLDDEAYYATLNTADIPCVTRVDSAYAHAGLPFKLGEFLATGRPVIASRVSDVERMLEDRRDAMLVKPGDSDKIAEAVEHLIAQPEQAVAIGERARQKARAQFDYRPQGQALLAFLRDL